MVIVDLDFAALKVQEAMAGLLVEAFRANWPEAWPDLGSALAEVQAFRTAERICRVALTESAEPEVLGWIGGLPQYDGNVWELHPLVVAPARQRQGIGRQLVLDLEARVAERGGLTVVLGSDDEAAMTTLSNVDLYTDLWTRIAQVQNLRGHPFEFYQKLGYTISGVVPDANGRGKPDILMAKRVSASKASAT